MARSKAAESAVNLPGILFGLAAEAPDLKLYGYHREGEWRSMSRGEAAQTVANLAQGLRRRGVSPGDRVLLVSENRPEFCLAENAIMVAGAVTVPTYVTNLVADHAHVMGDSGARYAIVSTKALAKRVAEAAGEGGLDLLVCMEGKPDHPNGAAWDEVVAEQADLAMTIAEAAQIPPGALACLIYTSGTGGKPKGVMLPHRALVANCRSVRTLINELKLPDGSKYLSFLPLSHSYEHTVGGFLIPSCGMQVIFARGADKLVADFAEHAPEIITAVPRLFEVIRERILAQVEKDGGLKKTLFDRALALGLRKLDGPPLGLLDRAQDAVLDRLVRDKIRGRFGGKIAALVSGGARLDPELSGFFLALGLPVLQGYGQSEAGPVISVNTPWSNDRRTVGEPLPGVEVRIAPDGEILVRGDLLMLGYWNNPDATAATLRPADDEPADGAPWLHTGDVGRLEQGRIVITDRKKDFLKLKGGDMVAPSKVESLLCREPEVAQCIALGEGMAGVAALIVPAEGREAALGEAVARVNAKLSPIERIRRWKAVPEAFTVENGLATPTMKIKRRQVMERYRSEVEALAQ